MPVSGYDHKRVWQYKFLPQPYAILDRGWNDRAWERDLIERLRRGEAAPRSLSVHELCPPASYESVGDPHGFWIAEKRTKLADRSKSAFLKDEDIAVRNADRKLKREAYIKWLTADRARLEAIKARTAAKRAAEQAAREEAWRAYDEHKKAQAEQRRASDSDWKEVSSVEHYVTDRVKILTSRYRCLICGGEAKIAIEGDGYLLTCQSCGKTAYGSQNTMAAQNDIMGKKNNEAKSEKQP